MVWISLLFTLLNSVSAQLLPLGEPPSRESLALKLDRAVCLTIPHSKFVKTPLNALDPTPKNFELFYFTEAPFNPAWPSMIYGMGGPGALQTSPAGFSQLLPNHNVFYIHVRGGGCTTFPLDPKYDALITAEFVARDIEHLRKALKIERWRAFVGSSYDTNTARIYARLFPHSVQHLILDGVDGGAQSELLDLPLHYRLINTLTQDAAKIFSGVLTRAEVRHTKRQIEEDLLQMTLYPKDSLLGYLFDQAVGQPLALKRSREYGLALQTLVYAGELDAELRDVLLFTLFGEFKPAIRAMLTGEHFKHFARIERQMFPFRFADYADLTNADGAVSWRVYLAMEKNAQIQPLNTCSDAPVLALHGTLDIATPLASAEKALRNKSCQRGKATLAVFANQGHGVLENACALALILNTLNGETQRPSSCGDDVRIQEL